MSVAFDADATADTQAAGVTSADLTTLTVGSGANRGLIVQLSFSLKTVTSPAVTWDNGASNQACTQIITHNSSGASGRAELWGRVAPVSGAKTLHAAWTGASDVHLNAFAVTGMDQTGGATSFPNSTFATGSSAAPSVTITSVAGDLTTDCADTLDSWNGAGNQTQTFQNSSGTTSGAGSRAAGAATVTHSWVTFGSNTWVSVGTDVAAVAAATGVAVWLVTQ